MDVAGNADLSFSIGDPTWTPAGIAFDGSDILDRASGTYTEVGGDFSVCVDVAIADTGSNRHVIHYGSTGSVSGNWALKINRFAGTVSLRDHPDGGTAVEQVLTFSSSFDVGRMYSVMLTRTTAGAIVAYRDGGDVQTTTGQSGSLAGAQATKPLDIGGSEGLSGSYFGELRSVAVWNRILTQAEAFEHAVAPYRLITPRATIIPSSGGAPPVARPQGPLSHPFSGPFGGPI